jgi:peptidoglycan/LPS O-acetylase OafA/YrhL
MAMIVNGKYANYSSFIINRGLKLFPSYWVVLVLCYIYSENKISGLDGCWKVYCFIFNVFMIGSHLTSAIVERAGNLGLLPFGEVISSSELTWMFLLTLFFLMLLCFQYHPFVFEFTKNNKIDRFFGDLSYPIYILHLFFYFLFPPFKGLTSADWNGYFFYHH